MLTPTDLSFDVIGQSIEGGRSLSGITQAIDFSGGGLVAASYSGITLMSRAQHLYWNKLAGLLNGSVRAILVPLWMDGISPIEAEGAATIAAAALHETLITITKTPAPEAGQWFEIDHGGTLLSRAYRLLSVGTPTGSAYPCEIRPALRAAIGAAKPAQFWRPRCLMRLPAGETMPWTWQAPGVIAQDVGINFVEAF
jgi:hypothetical protein